MHAHTPPPIICTLLHGPSAGLCRSRGPPDNTPSALCVFSAFVTLNMVVAVVMDSFTWTYSLERIGGPQVPIPKLEHNPIPKQERGGDTETVEVNGRDGGRPTHTRSTPEQTGATARAHMARGKAALYCVAPLKLMFGSLAVILKVHS